MSIPYPIHFAAQLRQHLRAFRKARNLTQAQLGSLVGVSQGRIAEIEANPGLVKFEQLIQILSAMEITLSLTENASAEQLYPVGHHFQEYSVRTNIAEYIATPVPKSTRSGKTTLSAPATKSHQQTRQQQEPAATTSTDSRTEQVDRDDQPVSMRRLVTRPKKGHW